LAASLHGYFVILWREIWKKGSKNFTGYLKRADLRSLQDFDFYDLCKSYSSLAKTKQDKFLFVLDTGGQYPCDLVLIIKKMHKQKFYDEAIAWLVRSGPGFLVGMIVLFVGLWLIKLFLRWSHSNMQKKGVDPTIKPFLLSLTGAALRVLLILGVMQIIGIRMTLFAALVGAFGVAAGLALSGTLQNFASGILILMLKPFVVGDNIVTQGITGTVSSIQIFYTLVTTFDNQSVIVPNSKLSNDVIVNMSRDGSRRLDIPLKFSNAIDFKQVKAIINASIDKCSNILATPERRIGISELQPDGYIVSVNVWINAHGFQDTKQEMQETILQDIKDAGVKIAGL
jgi:small conductance mechanosensitive channel